MEDQPAAFSVYPYIFEITLIVEVDNRLIDLFDAHLFAYSKIGHFQRYLRREVVKPFEFDLRDLLRKKKGAYKHPGEYDFFDHEVTL
jgi:hypothetical protein